MIWIMDDKGQILLYQTANGTSRIEVRLQNETVWLTLDQMAELFQRNKSTISRHIKNILEVGELDEKVVVAFFATTTPHGAMLNKVQTHNVAFYNLDMIISVGYRVNSLRGVQFRQWATSVLREYLIKGFALNDDFLKLSGKQLLTHAGKISAEVAKAKADAEYNKFHTRIQQQLSSVEHHFLDSPEAEQKQLQQHNRAK